jgi:hypothetical protein
MLRSVALIRATQLNIREDAILHSQRRENLKSSISSLYFSLPPSFFKFLIVYLHLFSSVSLWLCSFIQLSFPEPDHFRSSCKPLRTCSLGYGSVLKTIRCNGQTAKRPI